MGGMKRYAERISMDMNLGGRINQKVMDEAQRRLDEAEAETEAEAKTDMEQDDEGRRV